MGPPFEGGYESVLGEVFGNADVADDTGEGGNETCRLDAPDGVDGAVDIVCAVAVGGLHQG